MQIKNSALPGDLVECFFGALETEPSKEIFKDHRRRSTYANKDPEPELADIEERLVPGSPTKIIIKRGELPTVSRVFTEYFWTSELASELIELDYGNSPTELTKQKTARIRNEQIAVRIGLDMVNFIGIKKEVELARESDRLNSYL